MSSLKIPGTMKIRNLIVGLLALVTTLQVTAQRVENDDMYFTSKDREKLKVAEAESSSKDTYTSSKKKIKKDEPETLSEETSNPTDSYSARTINPEYISRSNSAQASEDEQNYYVEGYTPANTSDSYSSNNYNNSYSNNQYANYNSFNNCNNRYGAYGYDQFYSPYYGYSNPWLSPYYSSPGWTLSIGSSWGNSWGNNYGYGNYGYGGGCGCGNSFYNSYSYFNNPYYYSPYYSSYYNYGGSGDTYRINYGKRPSRNSAFVTPIQRTVTTNASGKVDGRGRQASDEYYVKPFRRTVSENGSVDNSYQRGTTSEYSRPRTREVSSESSSPGYSRPQRSSSSFSSPSRSSSSPGRSGGGSSGGGGSRSRGHN
jgi:hypothetical protein